MRSATLVALASVAISSCSASALTQDATPRLVSRQRPDPPQNRFVRRADVAVTVLDDYLYIVGGGVAVHLPGEDDNAESRVAGVNVTLALSLKDDWRARDAEYDIIDADDFPTAIGHALWANEDDKKVVFWGGKDFGSDRTGSSDPKVWTLAADGNGGGEWTSEELPDGIKRAAFGAYTQCGGKGFFVGGHGEPTSDSNAFEGDRIAVPGMISYDFAKDTWKNESTEGLTDNGAFQKGSAVCVTLPDRKPKLFVVGGAETTLEEVTDNDVNIQSFDNAVFWDFETEKWMKQETQGSRPSARQGTCAVGAAGPNGTYEIFMYGGFREGGGPLDDVWVLSIPAFRWFRVEADSDTRYSHACARVGSQMIVVGGNDNPVWNKKDPFDKGLGVFSLNTLSWEEGFEADSATYQGPTVVREWYNERGRDTIPWGSDEIKESFLSTDDGDDDGDDGSSTSPDPPSSSPDPEEEEDSNSTPAIVGGVVGGVLGLAAIGLGIWFWRRRKAKGRDSVPIVEADESFAMKPHGTWASRSASEMDAGYSPPELNSPSSERAAEVRSGKYHRAELQGSGSHAAVELPA